MVLPEACHRTRQRLSLRLDLELSSFEQTAVDRHLDGCPACAAFAEDLELMTDVLREAELDDPHIAFELPRRRSRLDVARTGAIASVAALLAMTIGGVTGLVVHTSPNAVSPYDLQGPRDPVLVREHLALVRQEPRASDRSLQGVEAAQRTTIDRSAASNGADGGPAFTEHPGDNG